MPVEWNIKNAAPEIFLGIGDDDGQSDVWSLATAILAKILKKESFITSDEPNEAIREMAQFIGVDQFKEYYKLKEDALFDSSSANIKDAYLETINRDSFGEKKSNLDILF